MPEFCNFAIVMELSLTNILLVGAGSCLGGMARYIVSKLISTGTSTAFPWGTLTVNILGCLILGLVCGFIERGNNISTDMRLFLTVGFCGGFTTFSTFMNENFLLSGQSGIPIQAILYSTVSLIGGFVMLYTGYRLGRL